MAHRLKYKLSKQQYEKFQDTVIWGHIEKMSVNELILQLLKYLEKADIRIQITNKISYNTEEVMGMHIIKDHYDVIQLNHKHVELKDLPSLVIHECLHGLFPQIENDDLIVALDRKIMAKATRYQINQIMNAFFKHSVEYDGPISRKLATTKRERGE